MQKFSLKNYKTEIILFYALAAAALVVAAFFDLKIDIALNNPSNFAANWFAQTGEMPAAVLLVAATAVMARCFQRKWLKGLSAAGCLVCGGYLGKYIGDRLFTESEFQTGYGVLFGVGTALLFLFALHFIDIPERIRLPLICVSVIGIVSCGVMSELINVMKTCWGRVRFRDLNEAYDAFTAWYTINGDTGNHSFPSGHTGSAGMSYCMMLLPFVSEKWKQHYHWCFLIAFLYTSTVAATRLVMGAHYLSDVTVGGTIAFSSVLLGMFVYEKISAKYIAKKQERA